MRMSLSAHVNQCAFQGVNFTCLPGRIPIFNWPGFGHEYRMPI